MSTIGQQVPAEQMGQFMSQMAEALGADPFEQPLQAMLDEVKQQHRDNFTSSAAPDGTPWQPRKHQGDGHPLLIKSGDLLQAATGGGRGHIGVVGDGELMAGVDVSVLDYAAEHQHGNQQLPPRPFVGVPEQTLDDFEEELVRHVVSEVL